MTQKQKSLFEKIKARKKIVIKGLRDIQSLGERGAEAMRRGERAVHTPRSGRCGTAGWAGPF
jgi:hypothetical protein